jgi:hypothetical protein
MAQWQTVAGRSAKRRATSPYSVRPSRLSCLTERKGWYLRNYFYILFFQTMARDGGGDRKLFRSNEIDRVGGSNLFIGSFLLGKERGDMWPRARDRATQYHEAPLAVRSLARGYATAYCTAYRYGTGRYSSPTTDHRPHFPFSPLPHPSPPPTEHTT